MQLVRNLFQDIKFFKQNSLVELVWLVESRIAEVKFRAEWIRFVREAEQRRPRFLLLDLSKLNYAFSDLTGPWCADNIRQIEEKGLEKAALIAPAGESFEWLLEMVNEWNLELRIFKDAEQARAWLNE